MPVLFLTVILLIIYIATLAPGLSWANNSSDGGDLITAAATDGVAHPTGYPTYLLIARIFQLIPIGSIAYRTNLLSAIAVTGAAVCIYFLVVNISDQTNQKGWIAGLVSSFAFGLAPIIWSQAVITEVYSLHIFFIALILLLLMRSINRNSENQNDALLGLIFGLSLGNHMSAFLLAPLVFSIGVFKNDPTKDPLNQKQNKSPRWTRTINKKVLFKRILWIMLGLCIYLTLFIRARSNSPINWENPVTVSNLLRLISGQLYSDYFFDLSLSLLFTRIQAFATIFLSQSGIIGLLIGLYGFIFISKPRWLFYASLWIIICSFIFAISYNTFDSYLYLIPIFIIFSIWIGISFNNFITKISTEHKWMGIITLLCIILLSTSWFMNNWKTVDASKDDQAEKFGQMAMEKIPLNAIVFANDEKASFSLWYFHFVLKERSDLIILSTDLLSYSWYRERMRAIYPSILIPDPKDPLWKELMTTENSNRTSCDVSFIGEPQIYCSK